MFDVKRNNASARTTCSPVCRHAGAGPRRKHIFCQGMEKTRRAGWTSLLFFATMLCSLQPCAAAAERLSDPTRPTTRGGGEVGQRENAASRWQLQSILIAEGRRTAVINDTMVGVGDNINGARVVEILPHAVHLRTKGGLTELTLTGFAPEFRQGFR